jgi:phenylacetate-CoA ligase
MDILRTTAFQLFHGVVRRDGLLRTMAECERRQTYSPDRLQEYQAGLLLGLMRHALTDVPYYRGLELPVCATEDPAEVFSTLKSWPLLSKAIIRAEARNMNAESLESSRFIPNATSGSTGESLRFFVDTRTKNFRAASTYRFFGWGGVGPTDRHAKLWGARFDEPSRTSLSDHLKDWLHPSLFLSSYRISEDDLRSYARSLRSFKPKLLISYPSPLTRFAEYCENNSIELSSLEAIITSAEQLHEVQRSRIEAALKIKIYNRYGSREFGNVAQECSRHEGLHVAADSFYLEILDEHGDDCPPGVTGEIVITDLRNEVMPFIRYRTGDLGSWKKEACSCGRTLPLLQSLEGRTMDLIRGPQGHVISGTFWPQILKQACPAIRNFQIHQESTDKIQMKLLMDPRRELSDAERAGILRKVDEYAPGLKVDIAYVEEIESTRSGKHRMVVSTLSSG